MRKCLLALAIMPIVLSGCGQTTPQPTATAGAPHGGTAFVFPDKKGSVEILGEVAAKDTAGASKSNSHQIVAYFFQGDNATPLSPPPTGVKVNLGDSNPVALALEEQGGKSGRFASPPGPYSGDLRGVLEAMVGDRQVEVPFSLKR
jgi:hypothetical protein